MSEILVNAAYFLMAAMFFAVGCWKGLAFTREPTVTLALMTVNFFIGGAVYVFASPVGYQWLGAVFGQPWIATLPIYIGILVCYGKMHLLTLLWTPTHPEIPGRTMRTVTAWALAYCASLVVMIWTFFAADLEGPADPLRFNTELADQPLILVFLAVFLVMLTSGTLNTWLRSRKAEVRNEKIAHALRWFGRSMVVTFGYVLCSGPAILAASAGYHQLDSVGVMGASFGMLGCVGTCYGLSGAAISAWLRERRDIAVLQPLWDQVVVEVDDQLSFSSHQARPNRFINIRWTLHRRIIEILDGIRALRKWISDEPAQMLMAVHRQSLTDEASRERLGLARTGLSPQELEAAVTAAVLRYAVGQLKASQGQQGGAASPSLPESGRPTFEVPGTSTAASQERQRLVRVARALNHPLVEESLRLVTADGNADQTRQQVASAA
ncbi:DUF6545 domain-containing protein [Streptomyces sp. NPDC014735]|uniref:DUF6545 domain-containing protein n=1 Tax=Streptomyces sp. NPDC014735 TaxID=3364887 RepID=UPI0036FA0941